MHNREVDNNQPQQRREEEDKMKFTKSNWGQLWYNLNTERVERVVARFNGSRVTTVWHDYSEESRVKENHLVKANTIQVADYRRETAERKEQRRLPKPSLPLPPLPKLTREFA